MLALVDRPESVVSSTVQQFIGVPVACAIDNNNDRIDTKDGDNGIAYDGAGIGDTGGDDLDKDDGNDENGIDDNNAIDDNAGFDGDGLMTAMSMTEFAR